MASKTNLTPELTELQHQLLSLSPEQASKMNLVLKLINEAEKSSVPSANLVPAPPPIATQPVTPVNPPTQTQPLTTPTNPTPLSQTIAASVLAHALAPTLRSAILQTTLPTTITAAIQNTLYQQPNPILAQQTQQVSPLAQLARAPQVAPLIPPTPSPLLPQPQPQQQVNPLAQLISQLTNSPQLLASLTTPLLSQPLQQVQQPQTQQTLTQPLQQVQQVQQQVQQQQAPQQQSQQVQQMTANTPLQLNIPMNPPLPDPITRGKIQTDAKYDELRSGVIYVRNLPREINEQELKDVFSTFGNLRSMRKHTSEGKYFGAYFMEYHQVSGARLACKQMNGRHWGVHTVFANPAPSPKEFPPGKSEISKLPQSNTIYVSGIPFIWNDVDLYKLFSKFGQITNIKIITNNGRHSGYAFLDYGLVESAASAIDCVDELQVDGGRIINVNYAERRQHKNNNTDTRNNGNSSNNNYNKNKNSNSNKRKREEPLEEISPQRFKLDPGAQQ